MLAAVTGLFLLIRAYGEGLTAPATEGSAPRSAAVRGEDFKHVLLALAAVIVLGTLLAKLFVRLRQPPVIGEVIAGVLLGPSLLDFIHPGLAQWLLPHSAAPLLATIAQLGVILYLFLVGLELSPEVVRRQARAALAISQASMVVPFLLGTCMALYLYPRLSHAGVPFTSFALFLGVAMAITAFPVLARVLTDRGLTRTELGVLALTCAATGDVTAWCLLALVAGVAQARLAGALVVCGLALGYVAFMVFVVRPVSTRLVAKWDGQEPSRGAIALVFVALLLSALATDAIGIHALFGAFLLGAVIPHDSAIAHALTRKLGDLVTVLLLPAFFAYTGMRTRIGLVSGWDNVLFCALIIVVATVGKFGGTLVAARLVGLDWRTSASLGALMNTRGLMELIVLNVGLDLGVISPTLFAMMVLMALVTTLATAPLLALFLPATLSKRSQNGDTCPQGPSP